MKEKYVTKKKRVVCVNTGEMFKSIAEAQRKYSVGIGLIGRVCKGIRASAGKLNGEPLKWMFEEDYNNLSLEEKKLLCDNIHKNRIVCLNTREVFPSSKEASMKYNLPSRSVIACCNNAVKTAGTSSDGIPLTWMYYEDFSKLTNDEVEDILKKRISARNRSKVICLNTMEVFPTIIEASMKYPSNNISSCCLGIIASSGKLNGEKLRWMYYEDYLKLSDNKKEAIS